MTLTVISTLDAAPRNVVVILGEGLGKDQYALAKEYAQTAYEEPLQAVSFLERDSVIAFNGQVGLAGVLTKASEKGYTTGLVTTDDVISAAARFYGTPLKGEKASPDDVEAMLAVKGQVVLGGGLGYFIPQSMEKSLRKDRLDMLVEARAKGWKTLTTPDELFALSPGTKALGLFSDKGLNYALDTDPMKVPNFFELVESALTNLNSGYFLLIHNNLMAKACKEKDPAALMEEVRMMDSVIASVAERAAKTSETLLVVIASPAALKPVLSPQADRAESLFTIKSLPVSLSTGSKKAAELGIEKWIEEHYVNFKASPHEMTKVGTDPGKIMDLFVSVFNGMTNISWEPNTDERTIVRGLGAGWDKLQPSTGGDLVDDILSLAIREERR